MESFFKAYWIGLVVSIATLVIAFAVLTTLKADANFTTVLCVVMVMIVGCVYLAIINMLLFFSLVVLFFLIAQKLGGFSLLSALF